ncbi:helix-turn-helix domain-containing protein [Arcanobacterium hippocoleae]|uniref:helix-turn-helix domain-containing protein n=1 Tax=Arcanobacterium hippocoleae TaxID=149017 RepID=UPI0035B55AD7
MQKLGITQKELSEKTGISEPTLSRVFKFSRVPDLNEVEQICSTLNLRLSRLARQAEDALTQTPQTPKTIPASPRPDAFIN